MNLRWTRGQAPSCGARQATVEEHDAPRAHVDESVGDERLAAQLAPQRLRLVMVTGQTQHGDAEGTEEPAEMCIAAWVVLNDVTGDQHRIHGPIPRLRQR